MTIPKWATTVTPFSKILALVIFITFPIMGFLFGMQYQAMYDAARETSNIKNPNIQTKDTPIQNKKDLSCPENVTDKYQSSFQKESNFVKFVHPQVGYETLVPLGWKYNLEGCDRLKKELSKRYKYYDFTIYSPDYKESNIYGPDEGSEIYVFVQDTEKKIFGLEDLGQLQKEVGLNKRLIKVAGQQAVQMDSQYEGMATFTYFIYVGKQYMIKFWYNTPEEKNKRMNVYNQFLADFKIITNPSSE